MSYLHQPGLTFAGLFQANVPTGNNSPASYGGSPSADPSNWNPMGGGQFRLSSGMVTGVRDDVATGPDDPISQAVVADAADRVAAKIVDLDTQYQTASELYGLRVRFLAGDVELLSGEFEPASFRDLGGTGHARFVSVLRGLTWAPPGTSGFLDRLRAATADEVLAIRLTTYDFMQPGFLLGRVVGAVGCYRKGEPRRFVAGRHLRGDVPRQNAPTVPLNDLDGLVDDACERLTVDLSNSLAVDGPAFLPDDLDVRLGLLTGTAVAGDAVRVGEDVIPLGEPLPFRHTTWLASTSGLVTVDVPRAARELILDHPLALIGGGDSATVLLRETVDGWLVRADHETRRLEPGESFTTRIHVTRYGRPVKDLRLDVRAADSEPAGGPRIGYPQGMLTWQAPEPTGDDGQTTLVVSGEPAGPGNPRGDIDGQIYKLRLANGLVTEWDLVNDTLGVHLYDRHPVPAGPTWLDDVLPLLMPYALQYPLMTSRVFDVSDYATVAQRRDILRHALSLDITDPNHMPVTRDLSAGKRATILAWLALPDLPFGPPPFAGAPPPPQVDPTTAAVDEAPLAAKRRELRRNAGSMAAEEPEQ